MKTSPSGAPTVVCNLDAGHIGAHGVCEAPGLTPYLRWGDGIAWTAADARRVEERHCWRKTHVRRPYQTLGMWKRAHGLL